MDVEEYMVIDDNVTAREIPADEEIISIVKNCESNESDDGDLETEPLSYCYGRLLFGCWESNQL
jgi:hypothetical protein